MITAATGRTDHRRKEPTPMSYRYNGELSTREELADGASSMQGLAAECYVKAVEAIARGANDYAIAWQKAHAIDHRAAAQFLRLLLLKDQRP